MLLRKNYVRICCEIRWFGGKVLVFENRLNNDSDFIDEAVPVFEIVSLLFVI